MPILGIIDSAKTGNLVTGSFEFIQTVYVASGTTSQALFTSIPQTYKHLVIRANARTNAGGQGDWIRCEVNGVTGSQTYSDTAFYGDGGAKPAQSGYSSIGMLAVRAAGTSSDSQRMGQTIMEFLDYTATDKLKAVKIMTGHSNNTGANSDGLIMYTIGVARSTSAITQLRLFSENSGALTAGTRISLYGIKG
jgi:hypothetical protein